ncbi:MAG: UpxY family transcription antiterminator [Parabacteroides sp.]|nr:UpxY family transcription antiterminator [Parabacteroides sp.]
MWNGQPDDPRFFYVFIAINKQWHKIDMNALFNAHTLRGHDLPLHVGFTSNVSPEAQNSDTGVSSDYAQKDSYSWFILRVTYNRVKIAIEQAKKDGIETYVPMHYVQKMIVGKKKRVLQPLLPNILFIYTTRDKADGFVKKTTDQSSSFIKYYLDKTLPPEPNGKNPPLTIQYNAMLNFIKATSTSSDHVRIVTAEQCHYKSGDMVRVIAGDFKGVTGMVARIAGQQRVVVKVSGLCLVATAYIPSDFIEIIK